jgi:hypothetical protein
MVEEERHAIKRVQSDEHTGIGGDPLAPWERQKAAQAKTHDDAFFFVRVAVP